MPAKEFARAHLPGAINIPLAKLSEKTIASLDKKSATIVYCYATSETWLPAASRLESLASKKFFISKPGKADWLAHGLPAVREVREPEFLWVMEPMQRELPTCGLDEPVGQAGARAEQRGCSICPVVNESGIVLGVIGKRDWIPIRPHRCNSLWIRRRRLCLRAIR